MLHDILNGISNASVTLTTSSSALGYLWLVAGLLLLMLEAGTPGLFYFIALSIGALCVSPFAFLGFSFVVQASLWVVASILAFLALSKIALKGQAKRYQSNINRLIGKQATVVETVAPHHPGRVKVSGELWPAIVKEGVVLQPGTIATITSIQGNKLIIS